MFANKPVPQILILSEIHERMRELKSKRVNTIIHTCWAYWNKQVQLNLTIDPLS